MGKIKLKLVKRTARSLLKEKIQFNEKFEDNKKILGSNTMPGKKIRNQLAGYLARLKKQEQTEEILKNNRKNYMAAKLANKA